MVEIDYRLVVKGAIELMKLPDSVKITGWDQSISVNRQKSPGQIWKNRTVTIDFEKWPVVFLQRAAGGEWDGVKNEADILLFKKIEINVAAPNGSHQLGRAIELLLGL